MFDVFGFYKFIKISYLKKNQKILQDQLLNKKGFFKQIENDRIKKGATIKFENIELEYK